MFYSLIVKVYIFLKTLFTLRDYTICKAYLEYTSPPKKSATWSPFWRREERDWGPDTEYRCVDVKGAFGRLGDTPEGVKDTYLSVEYVYDGKDYVYVTKNLNPPWPPKESMELTFSMPIREAKLFNVDTLVRDVTDELKQVMGPRKDFHGEDVPVEYLFDWNDYTDIVVVDALGKTKTLDKEASCLGLL